MVRLSKRLKFVRTSPIIRDHFGGVSKATGNFLADDFFADDFSADDFSADDFFADDFFADDFFADDFFADDFFADDFFADDFFADDLPAAAFSTRFPSFGGSFFVAIKTNHYPRSHR